ncbi:hypothetical protein N7520_006088 [Penicillium odoratum]|uniref:uncharacterized protein n=1 Tax=Penicillium odoratum TaxID=1167516 RepID=UPI002547F3FF|nr:uncharacterized protein N7520_006088 [Penicillium odoratum]KAJ5758932.1 hypothetical protein N7520_006088 [Penicillium odoratum]
MTVHCGCYVYIDNVIKYLPQVSLKAHATIFSTAARTTLTQTFVNPSDCILKEASYRFPLYDGVSVVGFQCHVGPRLLHSKVKSKEQANTDYENAIERKESAAIMDQSDTESDVFTIRLGNVPVNETVIVEITFIGELKQDAQMDGVRYTLPNSIAPRYQNVMTPPQTQAPGFTAQLEGISITADIHLEKASVIRELQSPSHSPKVSLGRVSSTSPDARGFEPSHASATLTLGKDSQPLLERDFVLVAKADGLDNPRALLESHKTIPGQRALMATLVPKFSLTPIKPEIVFVIDRSGSMHQKIGTLKTALKAFLKSLPLGVCFNICSFGSNHSFLWPSSKIYDKSSLNHALALVNSIGSDMGGTNMLPAVEATVQNRLKDKDLEVLLLTDGQIHNQQELFQFVRESAKDHTARFFSLGIGNEVSHALIEGVARAGQGFSQSVLVNEELDRGVIRMLKGALTPHIYDYKLEVDYDTAADQDFELVTPDDASMTNTEVEDNDVTDEPAAQPISLFSDDFKEPESTHGIEGAPADLPKISPPTTIQAPHNLPPLYPFIRTTAYLLLDPKSDRIPRSLRFSATSKQGPLCLRIPITDIGQGETVHQLASRKAVVELEERHGWLENIKDESGNPFKNLHSETQEKIVARECQNLGIKYQITGKYCSFVALESDSDEETQTLENKKPKEFDAGPATLQLLTARRPAHPPPPPGSRGGAMFGRTYVQASRSSFGSSPAHPILQVPQAQRAAGGLFRSPPPMSGRTNTHASSSLFETARPPPPCRLSQDAQAAGELFGSPSPISGRINAHSKRSLRVSAPPPPPSQAARAAGGIFGSSSPAYSLNISQPFASSQLPNAHNVVSGGSLFGRSTSSPPEAPKSKVYSLIELQTFEGSWIWEQQLFNIIGQGMEEIRSKVAATLQQSGKRDVLQEREANVVATLMIMGLLKREHQDSKALWELVYEKAESWVHNEVLEIQSEVVDTQSISTWMSLL